MAGACFGIVIVVHEFRANPLHDLPAKVLVWIFVVGCFFLLVKRLLEVVEALENEVARIARRLSTIEDQARTTAKVTAWSIAATPFAAIASQLLVPQHPGEALLLTLFAPFLVFLGITVAGNAQRQPKCWLAVFGYGLVVVPTLLFLLLIATSFVGAGVQVRTWSGFDQACAAIAVLMYAGQAVYALVAIHERRRKS